MMISSDLVRFENLYPGKDNCEAMALEKCFSDFYQAESYHQVHIKSVKLMEVLMGVSCPETFYKVSIDYLRCEKRDRPWE